MRLLLAIFLPPVVFFTIGRPIQGLLCLLLMVTLIGWPVAVVWAVYALLRFRDEELERRLTR